jgi:uncharacterized protein YciI
MLRRTILALLIAAGALAQTPVQKQFLLRIEPVRKDFTLLNMNADERKIAGNHFLYLKSLHDEGKLALAAQVFDPKGLWGVIIVNAADAEAATALLNGDPGIKAGMFRGEVMPTRVVLDMRN